MPSASPGERSGRVQIYPEPLPAVNEFVATRRRDEKTGAVAGRAFPFSEPLAFRKLGLGQRTIACLEASW